MAVFSVSEWLWEMGIVREREIFFLFSVYL